MKKWRRLAAWAQARWGKLAVLAERGARVWAAHWVLIVGSFLVFCSVLLKWVEFPLSQNLSGLQLPLLRNVGLIAHVYLLSFGVLGIGVLITGLVLLRLSGPLLALAAAILITLSVVVPCQIAFQQPALLRRYRQRTVAICGPIEFENGQFVFTRLLQFYRSSNMPLWRIFSGSGLLLELANCCISIDVLRMPLIPLHCLPVISDCSFVISLSLRHRGGRKIMLPDNWWRY